MYLFADPPQVIVASVASVVVNRKAEAAGCSMAHLGPKGALRMRLLGLLQRPGVRPSGLEDATPGPPKPVSRPGLRGAHS